MSIFNTVDIGAEILSFVRILLHCFHSKPNLSFMLELTASPQLSPTNLANIRLTSHHMNSLATPLLYRHLDLDFSSVEAPGTLRFLTVLFARPAFKIRTVTITFGTTAHRQDSRELQYRFALVIGLVQRLQDLQVFTYVHFNRFACGPLIV